MEKGSEFVPFSRWPPPLIGVSPLNSALVLIFASSKIPLMAAYFYGLFRLLFGTLYPAYASYKAVKTKNVKEYVKWMMYWIVFAFFTCAETVTDILFSFWFPFYYEIKIILVIWLLSPVTKGSSILYRKFVHPELTKREEEIDNYIARAREQGYNTVLQIGVGGFNFARELLVQAALKGHGGIVEQLKRSYSLNDLSSETDGPLRMSPPRQLTATGEVNSNEMDMMDYEPRPQKSMKPTRSLADDSETETVDAPTVSSGYSSAVDTGSGGDPVALPSTAKSIRQRNTRNSTKTSSSSRKTIHSNNTEESIYATLPRSSKRTTRRKTTLDDA